MTERKTMHGPGPNTKGGGFRGGPKRWNGGGPAPARHVPWPEVRAVVALDRRGTYAHPLDFQTSYISLRGPLEDGRHGAETYSGGYR